MYKNPKHTIIFPLVLAAGVIAGMLFGNYIGRNNTSSQLRGMLRQLAIPDNKITHTLSLIEHQYVDSISMDSLAEDIIPLLVKKLDPHSIYLSAAEMEELNAPLEGEFDGIGVVFNMATDTVIILNVIPKGPSDKAGVKAGDRIIEINDSIVAGRSIPQNDIVKTLRGARGTTVHLGISRQGIDELVGIDVVRDKIPVRSIESAFQIVPGIGYIKLGQFSRTTAVEMRLALMSLKAEGATKLIFDLRGNSGGYLDQAILVANEFLHKGQLIVYTEDRRHEQVREHANGEGTAQDMNVTVLIDENSASSSEILAGALQDNDRGTIIGRRSYGKGLVQQQIPYSDGSALRLTTARYYTPTGRSIQRPYTNGDEEGYAEDLWNRYANNEFFTTDSIRFDEELKKITPGGKVVYGGGGIMPDVFVPADTTDVTRYYLEVAGRNILYRYTIEYADRHREELNAVTTVEELTALLDSDKTLVDDFIRYAARKGVAPNRREIARSRKLIEAQLRAYIGRNTSLEDNGYYANIYPIDVVTMRAIEVLNTPQESAPQQEGFKEQEDTQQKN